MKWRLHLILLLTCIFSCNILFASAEVANTLVVVSANVPSTPTLTPDSENQITANWSTNSNSPDTQYYIENITNLTNSGWIAGTSWPSSGLLCSTNYSFRVKARNSSLVETSFSPTSSGATLNCTAGGSGSGTGGSGSIGVPPIFLEKPLGPFSLVINNGQGATNQREVVLSLNAGSNVATMSVSNDPNFINSVQQPYQPAIAWILADGDGKKTVYTKFFTRYGVSSDTIWASINYIAIRPADPGAIAQLIQKIKDLQQQLNDLLYGPKPPVVSPVEPPVPPVVQKPTPPSFYPDRSLVSDWSSFFQYMNWLLLLSLLILLFILWEMLRRRK